MTILETVRVSVGMVLLGFCDGLVLSGIRFLLVEIPFMLRS